MGPYIVVHITCPMNPTEQKEAVILPTRQLMQRLKHFPIMCRPAFLLFQKGGDEWVQGWPCKGPNYFYFWDGETEAQKQSSFAFVYMLIHSYVDSLNKLLLLLYQMLGKQNHPRLRPCCGHSVRWKHILTAEDGGREEGADLWIHKS